jgi:hypothetical protein
VPGHRDIIVMQSYFYVDVKESFAWYYGVDTLNGLNIKKTRSIEGEASSVEVHAEQRSFSKLSIEVEETDQHIAQAEIGKLILRVLVYNRLRGRSCISLSIEMEKLRGFEPTFFNR